MKFEIDVRDVNGGVVVPAAVKAIYSKPKPGGLPGEKVRIEQQLVVGSVHDLPLADATVLFAVAGGIFADETIAVSEVGGRWLTDSPAGSATKQGDLVTLKFTLGCIRLAPTVALPAGFPVKDNPRAALVDTPEGGKYHHLKFTPESFRRFEDPIDFKDPAAAG